MPVELLRAAKPRENTKVFLYAWKHEDRVEIKEYLATLNKIGSDDLRRLVYLFDTFANSGIVYNAEKFKSLGDDCFEFKASGGARIGCFLGDKEADLDSNHTVLILTHGFKKPVNNKAYKPHKTRIREIAALYRAEREVPPN